MEVIVIEKEAWYRLLGEMKRYVRDGIREGINPYDEWLSLSEAKKVLNVKSKSKMQQLRDEREITFTQHGRTIQYSRKSCLEFLERNSIKSK